MRFFMFMLGVLLLLTGCMALKPNNKFIKLSNTGKGFVSQCKKSFFAKEDFIDYENIYVLKYYDGKVYVKNNGMVEVADIDLGIYYATLLPIESCNDKWCKIYYPCGDVEYFVEKNEIAKRDEYGIPVDRNPKDDFEGIPFLYEHVDNP